MFLVGSGELAVNREKATSLAEFQFSTTCNPVWTFRRSSSEARKSQAKIVRTTRPSSSNAR
jgi:hypothetical protein